MGCRQFILSNAKDINNIIFVSNGGFNLYAFVEPSFAYQRRKESEGWVKSVCPKTNIFYLNVPDMFSYSDLVQGYASHLFKKANGKNRVQFLKDQISEIIKDDVLLYPNKDNHPMHVLTYHLGKNITDKSVAYHIHHVFEPSETTIPGIYVQEITEGIKLNIFVYTEEEYLKKQKEFQLYYVSQYKDFQKSKFIFYPHEMYVSNNVDINLELLWQMK